MEPAAPPPGGGRLAVSGFRYQFLRTFEAMLAQLAAPDGLDWEVWVDEPGVDAVDYRVVSGGRTLCACQVKSSYDPERGRPLGEADAVRVLGGLCAATEADRYLLQSNRTLTEGARRLAGRLADGTGGPLGASLAADLGVSPELLANRLGRARIETDDRGAEQLSTDLEQALTRVRRSRDQGVGRRSAQVLLNHCVAQIFRSAAGPGWVVSREEFSAMLSLDDATLALATGQVDWGATVALALPPLPAVERAEEEQRLREALGGGQCRRAVQSVVLSGLSGIGKSSLAAGHAHRHATAYDLVLWLNAETPLALTESVRRALPPDRNPRELDDDQVAPALHAWLGETPLTWLAVFDGAPDVAGVHPWLPTSGSGHCVVTTTDSTGASTLARVVLGPMNERDAHDLVASRLGRRLAAMDDAERRTVALVADGAEHWPLAVELLTAYLVDSGRGLAVAPEVLALLREEVLDDDAYVPPGYPRSLVAAIRLALRQVGGRPYGEAGLRLLDRASLMDNEAIPTLVVGPVRAAGRPPAAEAADQLEVDRAVTALRRASLVERSARSRAPHPVLADTVSVNAIVAEIVRGHLERDRDALAQAAAELFCNLAAWVGDWTTTRRLVALEAVRSHVETVLARADEYRLTSMEHLTLMGNLAAFYQWQGRHHDAIALYEGERGLLHNLARAVPALGRPDLLFQTDTGLVASLVRAGSPVDELVEVADEALDLVSSGRLAADDERLAVAATNLVAALALARDTTGSAAAARVVERARGLLPGAADALDDPAGQQRVEELLRAGRYDAAAELAADIASRPSFTAARTDRAFVLGNLAQAELARGDVPAALAALERLKEVEEFAPGLPNRHVVLTALDLAGALTARVLLPGHASLPIEALVAVVDQSDLSSATDHERWQSALLRAWAAHRAGDAARATALLEETVRTPSRIPVDGDPFGWELLRSWLRSRQHLATHQPSFGLTLLGFAQYPDGGRLLTARVDPDRWLELESRLGPVTTGRWTTYGTTVVLDLVEGLWQERTIASLELDLLQQGPDWTRELPRFVAGYTPGPDELLVTGLWLGPGAADLRPVALPYGYRGLDLADYVRVTRDADHDDPRTSRPDAVRPGTARPVGQRSGGSRQTGSRKDRRRKGKGHRGRS